MRKLWTMTVAVVVLAGCQGAKDGTKPWDQNQDGLVTACEGLNHDTCVATAGCQLQPVYCLQACSDADGCLPCDGVDLCVPVAPPPPPDCSQLPVALCEFVPACEVQTAQLCTGVRGSDDAATPGMEGGCMGPPDACQTIQLCVNRLPPTCESLSVDACLSQPGCALEELAWACAAICEDDGHGGCLPCPAPPQTEARCVTVAPPSCDTVPLDRCATTPGCYVEDRAACPALCQDDGAGGCLPCTSDVPRCMPITNTCETRSADECTALPGCTLIQEAYDCAAVCEDDGNGGCLPCPQPAPRCVSTVSSCELRSPDECTAAAGCALIQEEYDCAAVCQDDGNGGCLPCPQPPPRCVPAGNPVDPDVGTGPDSPPPPRP